MSSFQYKSGSWTDVPSYAHPDDEGTVIVVYPETPERDGQGNPCAGIGLPSIQIQARTMRGDGWGWWQAFFGGATALTAAISLTAWDPRSAAWVKYAGTLLRPTGTVKPGASAGQTLYRDVSIVVERVTVTT